MRGFISISNLFLRARCLQCGLAVETTFAQPPDQIRSVEPYRGSELRLVHRRESIARIDLPRDTEENSVNTSAARARNGSTVVTIATVDEKFSAPGTVTILQSRSRGMRRPRD